LGNLEANAPMGFPDREISPLRALEQLAPGAQITYAVGDDLTGVPIPCNALSPSSGTGSGLLRTQTTPNTGATQVDPQIGLLGANALPVGTAYPWTGTLTVPTSGTYALMLQCGSGNAARSRQSSRVGRSASMGRPSHRVRASS
jgi:beta-glucosidase